MSFCSSCGEKITPEAKFCPSCGIEILSSAPEFNLRHSMKSVFARGIGGEIEAHQNRIILRPKGVLGLALKGLRGDKTIYLKDISSIQFKKAGHFTNGYIQFAFHGGKEAKGGLFQATKDENTIMFNKSQQINFEKVRDFIEKIITSN